MQSLHRSKEISYTSVHACCTLNVYQYIYYVLCIYPAVRPKAKRCHLLTESAVDISVAAAQPNLIKTAGVSGSSTILFENVTASYPFYIHVRDSQIVRCYLCQYHVGVLRDVVF